MTVSVAGFTALGILGAALVVLPAWQVVARRRAVETEALQGSGPIRVLAGPARDCQTTPDTEAGPDPVLATIW